MKKIAFFLLLAFAAIAVLSQAPSAVSTAQARPTPGPPVVPTPNPTAQPVSSN